MATVAQAVPKEEKKSTESPGIPQKPKRDFVGVIVLFLVTVNLMALGGMGYFLQQMWNKVKQLQMIADEEQAIESAVEEKPVGTEFQGREVGVLISLDAFLVNLPSDQGAKFLQAQMELELADPSAADEITRKKPIIRDSILVLLSSRSYKELRDPGGMTKLKGDIIRSINANLSSGKIKDLYFTQFHFN